jgi:hypothetical protein
MATNGTRFKQNFKTISSVGNETNQITIEEEDDGQDFENTMKNLYSQFFSN